MKRPVWWVLGAIAGFIAIAIGVRVFTPGGPWLTDATESTEDIDPGLVLRDVTLEQQDEDGNLLWKVNADEVTYSANQEVANLVNPEGEFYQDGELIYRAQADWGTIQENGQIILLENNLVATGIRNGMIINGQTLEWQPSNDLMVISNGLTGSHPQVRAKANTARIYERENRMELIGNVIATTVTEDPQVDPWVKFQGETLQWRWQDETLDSDRPIRVERFENQQITQVLTGQRSLIELAAERVTLEEAVQAQFLDMPMNLTTDKAIWELPAQTIQAERSVRVVNPEEQITVTSQRGQFDLEAETAVFNQDVLAIAARNNGQLTSNRLQWNLSDQTVVAEGSVNYQQSDPQFKIRGERARGRIEEQVVVVDGGDVVTEIQPNF
ncbi:MAG: LPS export ABC transporter periplasmic protein LptC [Cyanobacteria bacterium P01_H01_bin.153]